MGTPEEQPESAEQQQGSTLDEWVKWCMDKTEDPGYRALHQRMIVFWRQPQESQEAIIQEICSENDELKKTIQAFDCADHAQVQIEGSDPGLKKLLHHYSNWIAQNSLVERFIRVQYAQRGYALGIIAEYCERRGLVGSEESSETKVVDRFAQEHGDMLREAQSLKTGEKATTETQNTQSDGRSGIDDIIVE